MNKKPISTDSLENDMKGFSAFSAFPTFPSTASPAGEAASTETVASATPDANGNTDMPRKRRKPGNAGNTRNTARQSKTGKNGNTDKVAKTYKFSPVQIELIARIAYWQRRNIQDVIAEALTLYIETVPEEDKVEIKRKR